MKSKIIMKEIIYRKLVRDKIPHIIEQSGKTCVCERLPDSDYLHMLNEKLLEEVREFLESGSVEELADINEVIQAILAFMQVPQEEFQRIQAEKREKRGGFSERIFLTKVIAK